MTLSNILWMQELFLEWNDVCILYYYDTVTYTKKAQNECSVQVKNVYIRLLYTCYVDCGLDNKETFAKDHMWSLFNSSCADITKV